MDIKKVMPFVTLMQLCALGCFFKAEYDFSQLRAKRELIVKNMEFSDQIYRAQMDFKNEETVKKHFWQICKENLKSDGTSIMEQYNSTSVTIDNCQVTDKEFAAYLQKEYNVQIDAQAKTITAPLEWSYLKVIQDKNGSIDLKPKDLGFLYATESAADFLQYSIDKGEVDNITDFCQKKIDSLERIEAYEKNSNVQSPVSQTDTRKAPQNNTLKGATLKEVLTNATNEASLKSGDKKGSHMPIKHFSSTKLKTFS